MFLFSKMVLSIYVIWKRLQRHVAGENAGSCYWNVFFLEKIAKLNSAIFQRF